MLDSLLMAAVATRDGLEPLPPGTTEPSSIIIPLSRSECGRIYLCSQGLSQDDVHERRWKQQRFPLPEAQWLGSGLKRVNTASGPSRSYRIPVDTVHVDGDEIRWYAIGDPIRVQELLDGWVGYIGHKRSVGLGKVRRWTVEPCDTWPGFPVLRDGEPLRSLPVDWPGLSNSAEQSMRCLLPPYWRRTMEEPCAVPRWT